MRFADAAVLLVVLATPVGATAIAQEAPSNTPETKPPATSPEQVGGPSELAAPEQQEPAGEALPPPPPPPVPPDGVQRPAPSYFERCFAVPAQVWVPYPGGVYYSVPGANPLPSSSYEHAVRPVRPVGGAAKPAQPNAAPSLSGVDGKAVLILAVAAVAVTPAVVWALDQHAPAVVEQRFGCPTFTFDAVGGVDLSARAIAGAGAGRFTFGYSYFGADVQLDASSGPTLGWSTHLLFRAPPRSHVEPNVALGYRQIFSGGEVRSGFEVGVPHRYVFWRSGLKQLGLELRPTIMFGASGVDAGLEAAFIVPLVEPLHLRVGGKVHSFGDEFIGGANLGLTFTL